MFTFKKILAQFFSPLSLTLELLVIGLFLCILTSKHKSGKILIIVGTAILVFFSYTPTSDLLSDSLKNQYPAYNYDHTLRPDHMPRLVVVLSGGSIAKPSWPVASRLGYETLLRLIEGICLYRQIPDSRLLLSGGSTGAAISSAEEMALLARNLGVNQDNIIIDSKSLDTKDQARIIQSMIGNEQFILVTSSSHLPRSMALFKKLGMNPIPAPTQSIEERLLVSGPDPYFPNSMNLQKSEMALHEYLGIVWAELRGQI